MNQANAVREELTRHSAAALEASGVEIDDVVVQPAGKRRVVKVTVARAVDLDGPDETSPVEPLTLDEVAEASRIVSTALDETDVMGTAPYTLEVSSAGVGQPLTRPEHFRRNVGRLLNLTPADGSAPSQHRLLAADAHGIRTEADPDTRVPYTDLAKATVEVEFSKPTDSGKDR